MLQARHYNICTILVNSSSYLPNPCCKLSLALICPIHSFIKLSCTLTYLRGDVTEVQQAASHMEGRQKPFGLAFAFFFFLMYSLHMEGNGFFVFCFLQSHLSYLIRFISSSPWLFLKNSLCKKQCFSH